MYGHSMRRKNYETKTPLLPFHPLAQAWPQKCTTVQGRKAAPRTEADPGLGGQARSELWAVQLNEAGPDSGG